MITHFLAQADIGQLQAGFIKSMVIFGVVMAVVISLIVSAIVSLLQFRFEKKTRKEIQSREISPQPLAVQIVEELHQRFADKKTFEKHVTDNTQRHAQLFNRIDQVEESAGKEISGISKQVTTLQAETRLQSTQLQKLDTLEKEIRDMPGKIVVDLLNAQKLGRKHD